MIDQHRIHMRMKLVLETVYLQNVRRGPAGMLRKALRECLPGWAAMGLSFAGDSILEDTTDRNLMGRLIATLKVMGIVVITDFDISKAAKNEYKNATGTSIESRNETATVRRLNHCIECSRNKAANAWYKKELAKIRSHGEHTTFKTKPTYDGI